MSKNQIIYNSHFGPIIRHLKTTKKKLKGWLKWLRIQHFITQIIGPEYSGNRLKLEIDITWECNLGCYNCNRSCGQAPTKEHMTVEQLKHFIFESIATNTKWEQITLIGGEPTLHPDLLEIIEALQIWKSDFSPNTILLLKTNGYGRKVRDALKALPKTILVENSRKDSRNQPFQAFNCAPQDLKINRFADYRNCCSIINKCGLGLNPYGYYICPIAGGIDRIFGFDMGRKSIPTITDSLRDQYMQFCRLCGLFERRKVRVYEPLYSKSWEIAYQLYYDKKPVLSKYE